MNSKVVLAINAIIIAAFACSLPDMSSLMPQAISGSGIEISREEAITGFDSVDISASFDVQIQQAEEYEVDICVDDNLEEYLRVEKVGSTLKIGLKPNVSLQGTVILEAEIKMPELVGIDLSGASTARISGFSSSRNLVLDLSGSSSLKGDIAAGDTNLDISGSSDINLSGTGGNLILDASGSSNVDLSEYQVSDANLDVSGASSVTVNPGGTLNVIASGASEVFYLGEPTLGKVDSSGSSNVEAR
jgi:hypothetical protein